MKMERRYTVAQVKGLVRCYVSILDHDTEHDTYTCETPFGTVRTYAADDLFNFQY